MKKQREADVRIYEREMKRQNLRVAERQETRKFIVRTRDVPSETRWFFLTAPIAE